MSNTIDFDKLLGVQSKLYVIKGLGEIHQFQLGSVIFQVNEDEDDGYRSSMQDVEIITKHAERGQFLANIVINKYDDDSGVVYQLLESEDDHIWLEFGTDHTDDYYPSFVYNWQPKPGLEEQIKKLISL